MSDGIMDPDDLLIEQGSGFDRLADASSSSDIFTRQYGTELARWESLFLQQFRERISSSKYLIRGFVRHTRDTSLILMTPSPWLMEGEFVFFSRDQSIPDDGAYVEIIGRHVAAPNPLQERENIVRAITAESINKVAIDYSSGISPPMQLKELSNLLFEHVGMAEASKRVFARLFVSSPPYQDAIGGFTTGIQAIASQAQIRRFLSFVKHILPPSMRRRTLSAFNIRGIKVIAPKMFRVDIGSFSRSRLEPVCIKRKDPAGFQEVTLATLTESSTAALPDIPLTIASEDFWIESGNPTELQLPILKSAITYQLLSPEISSKTVEAATSHVLSGLETLQESFDLPENALSRGHVLDANAFGKPLSTLRIARSNARAYWKEKVTAKEVKNAWDKVLEPALKEFIEISEIKDESEKAWGKGSRFDKFNTKVLKAIRSLDTGKQGSLGPTLDEIAREAGVERHVAAETLERMKDSGVLYEPRQGHYRLV